MTALKLDKRILAIDPTSFGFGFAVLEGPHQLIDCGLVQVTGSKNARSLFRVEKLVRRYLPDEIVTEHPEKSRHRHERIRELLEEIRILSAQARTRYRGLTRGQIRRTFSEDGKATKYMIAKTIAGKFSLLARRLPAPRKPWMSENAQMAVFDAVALALTYFARR